MSDRIAWRLLMSGIGIGWLAHWLFDWIIK